MNLRNVTILALLAVLLGSLIGIAVYPRFKNIEKRGPAPDSVGVVLAGDVGATATTWAGEYLGFSAHAPFPTMLHDIRPVEATTTERRDILTMIQKSQGPH